MFESGSLYSPSVLDITEDDLLAKAKSAIANITAVSLATSYPTQVHPGLCCSCIRAHHVPLCVLTLDHKMQPSAPAAVCSRPKTVTTVVLPLAIACAGPACVCQSTPRWFLCTS